MDQRPQPTMAAVLPRLILFLLTLPGLLHAAPKPEAGLLVRFTSGSGAAANAADTTVLPGVALFVEPGGTPSPLLPPGRFAATWEGSLLADLRGTYVFQARLNGKLTVEINGTILFESSATNGLTPLSKPIQLNKGENVFKATFAPLDPWDAGAYVRLEWAERGGFTSPIPPAAFAHGASPALDSATQVRFGRELFLQHRCAQCHRDAALSNGVPELKMDAPSLEGIGARRRHAWMTQWLLDPKAMRPSAQMPKLFHGPEAPAAAQAVSAYLASLQTGGEIKVNPVLYRTQQTSEKASEEPAPAAGERKPLYERLHCIGCHNPPDATQPDPAKLSQKRVAEKFPPGRLAEYLRAPDAHYAWTRMPDFHLSEAEAKELEQWLFAAAPPPPASSPVATDAALVEKGKTLVQTSGCLNCHSLKLDNRFEAPKLADLRADRWNAGCLATPAKPESKAPSFAFTSAERAALQAFATADRDRASLTRSVPSEFAERQTRALNCVACHGALEGFPPLELLGGKLKPEWAARFIGGEIPHKIRYEAHPKGEPWLEARMPAFRSRARDLAIGLSARDGYGSRSPEHGPIDATLAGIGRKLVGKEGGFSCVSCHGVGSLLAMEVFESEGVNLVYSADRLQPDFYRRWLRAPTSVDPQTKMPVYFDEGKSPLTEVLGGDADKQIAAIWEYLQLREKMQPPVTGAE